MKTPLIGSFTFINDDKEIHVYQWNGSEWILKGKDLKDNNGIYWLGAKKEVKTTQPKTIKQTYSYSTNSSMFGNTWSSDNWDYTAIK